MKFRWRDIFFLFNWGTRVVMAWKGGVREHLRDLKETDPVVGAFWDLIQEGIDRFER